MASASRDEKSSRRRSKWKKRKCSWLRQYGFLLLLLHATVGGYVLGICLRPQNFSSHTIRLIGFPGQLMLRAFLMIIVPLLFCSLVLGISSLRKGGDARMVAVTLAFFLGLSTFSAIMGAVAGHLIHPGQKVTDSTLASPSQISGRKGAVLDSILDLIWNIVPNNIIEATFTKEYTHVEVVPRNDSELNSTNSTNHALYEKSIRKASGTNFMGMMMFSILFGCALASLGDKGEQLHSVLEQTNSVIMEIMQYFLNLLPIGMFFWMFREGLETTAALLLLRYLGVFLATAFGCIAIHQLILLPMLYLLIVRRNPIRFHLNLLPAILTAFGTASSAATLPATVRCAEKVNKLNKCVTRFVLPLGMVVHMNGGTFYLTLSSIFLAQLEGITLGATETTILCLTCILMMISAPGTVSGGNPIYLLTAMAAAGIDRPQFISLFLSMEWLMERFRTVMNVVADSYVAALVEEICRNKLPEDEDDTIEFESPVIDGYRSNAREAAARINCRQCKMEAI